MLTSEALGVSEERNEAQSRALESANESLRAMEADGGGNRRALEKVMDERDAAEERLVLERREADSIRCESCEVALRVLFSCWELI